ncbi:MAG: cache domain-containing protein [Deltaproteobacteria bacterium]|jgi:PAS domain S-box-containing protein|nr:cache domain-containing protein [Deltaproteobacteria bacterium]
MPKEPKHALTKVIPLLLTAVSLVSIILLAVMWINYEYVRGQEESERLTNEYYNEAETSLSLETNRICDYILAQTSSSQIKFYQMIKTRVQEVWNMLSGMEADPRLAGVDEATTKEVILAMLDNLSFSEGQSGYFCIDASGEFLLRWKGNARPEPKPGDRASGAARPLPVVGLADRVWESSKDGGPLFDPHDLEEATQSVKVIGEGFYRILTKDDVSGTPGQVPITFFKHYPKYDWILGASSYYSEFEKNLGQELLGWVDNVPLPPADNLLVVDYDGLILSYANPSLIGRNINEDNFEPAMKEALTMVITQAREKGKGLVRFSLPDSTGQNNDCLGYFRALNNWGWAVITWVNFSILDDTLDGLQKNLKANLIQQVKKVLLTSLGMLAMVAVISLVVSRKLGQGVNDFTKFFSEAATSSVEIDPNAQPFSELAKLARSANGMISKRLEAEQRMAENELKFRTVFDVSPQLITIMNSDGYLLDANDQFERYAKRPIAEVKGRSLAKILDIPKLSWSRFLDDLRHDKVIQGQELILKDPEGGDVYMLLFGKLMSFMDQDFVLGVCVDISDLRRAELEKSELKEKLSRSQRMEAMGLMAASVAHELNNILSGMIGYPELLLRDDTLSSGQRAQVNEILEAGQRATEVVGDMMTLARGVATAKVTVNLTELIEKSLTSPPIKIALAAATKPVEIDFKKPKKSLSVKGSPRHLAKVIQHLVVNAIEALETKDNQGKITITVEPERLTENPGCFESFKIGNYARLTVSDNGPGIPADAMERIFEPFYTDKSGSGRGLGLAVVDLVVRGHGGALDVKSGADGTIFSLYFLAVAESAKAKSKPALTEYLGSGQKILIVDDVDIQRKLAQKILKTLGYEPHSVSSGEEAVEYLKSSDADLVILDMIMDPGINGRETYEAILAIKPKQKAIIASGMAETDEVEKAQALGASYFVSKPYTIEDIAGAVYKALHPEP